MDRKNLIEALKSPVEVKNGIYSNKYLALADKIRHENVGDIVHLRGLIEFSNFCERNCLYCGLRLDNKNCKRYNLTETEIIKYAENAVKLGLKTIVLQSGENSIFDTEKMSRIIKEIKKFDVTVTLSLGEKSFEEYQKYKEAGASRYLLRIETTDKNLYKKMHPNMSFENRVQCLQNLKNLGYELGSGMLIGLPSQTIESIADDILFLKEIKADMVGLGPFIPSQMTPLKNEVAGDFLLTLKAIALVRIMLPEINIPATTAVETMVKSGRKIALKAGANVVMPNVVDYNISKNYAIYNNKFSNEMGIKETLDLIRKDIEELGRTWL